MRPDAPQKALLMLTLPGLLLAVNLGVTPSSPRGTEAMFLVGPLPEFAFAAGTPPTRALDLEASESGAKSKVDVSFQAPSEAGATDLARSLRSYLEAPAALWLRPPWHPDGVSPEEERARETYVAIRRAIHADLVGFDVAPLLQEGARRGRLSYTSELLAERARASAKTVANDPTHDPQVLADTLTLLAAERDLLSGLDRIDGAFAARFGKRLGQVDLTVREEGGEPRVEAEEDDFRFSAIGSVRVGGHRIDLGGLSFFRRSHGLSALARYLAEHGALDLRAAVTPA